MNNRQDLESRLRSYLAAGARRQPPAGMEERISSNLLRRGRGWAFQLMAAAALLLLALGLGVGLNAARQMSAGGVKPTPSPSVAPSLSASAQPTIIPSPSPTVPPRVGASLYPLMVPASMYMVNASTGWAAGSTTDRILRTSDGGAHWNDVTPWDAPVGSWTTFFLDANSAWIASSLQPGSSTNDFGVKVYRTSDGGRTWQHISTVTPDQGWPGAVDFVDARHGWLMMILGGAAGSEGVAFYGTADGGATWTELSEADTSGAPGHLPVSCSKARPVFLNPLTGWVPGSCNAGGGPFLYVSRDGGNTWNDAGIKMPSGSPAACACEIAGLRFSDSRNGVFVLNIYGDNGAVQNVLYTTNDAGAFWRSGPLLPPNSYTVFFLDPSHGWTLNEKTGSLLYSSDSGQHWSVIGTVSATMGPIDFEFITTTTGWMLGMETKGRPILKTVDGGATWTRQLSP